jgi:hypothetical protein
VSGPAMGNDPATPRPCPAADCFDGEMLIDGEYILCALCGGTGTIPRAPREEGEER